MKFFIAALLFVSSTSANALQLLCQLPSAKDGSLLETLRIVVAADSAVQFWIKRERTSYWNEHEEYKKVLFHTMTTSDGNPNSSKFSVIVVESRFIDTTFKIDSTSPPEVYFIDWGRAKLAQVNVPYTRDPLAQVDVRWECARLD